MAETTKKIGDVCRLVNGRAFKPSDWRKDGLRIIRIQNLNDDSAPFNHYDGWVDAKHLVDDGDVLLSWSGTPGTSFGCFIWNRGKAILNQHIFKVHLHHEVYEKDYFVFAVNSELGEMIHQAHGAVGLRHITKGRLEAMEIPYVPPKEQKRVIERIKECLARVEEMKGLREDALAEATSLLDALINALLFDASGTQTSLGDVVTIASALVDPRLPEYRDLLHIGGANIVSGNGELLNLQTASEENLISGKYLFTPQDVIYSKIRPKLRKVVRPDFNGLCSADSYPLRPIGDVIHRDFLFYLLLSRKLTDYAIGGSNRAGIPKVNREHLMAFEFALPKPKVQERIVTKLNASWNAAKQLASGLTNAEHDYPALRESMLREAFAGNL